METIIGILVLTCIYLVPMFIAILNKKKDVFIISLINILLGWSIVGWIVSFIWAIKEDGIPQQIIIKEEKPDDFKNYEKLEKLNSLKEKKIISAEEFEVEKQKLLSK